MELQRRKDLCGRGDPCEYIGCDPPSGERSGITVGSGNYHYEYNTQTYLKIEKYSLDSTLGELVADELGRKMFDELRPGMLDRPADPICIGHDHIRSAYAGCGSKTTVSGSH